MATAWPELRRELDWHVARLKATAQAPTLEAQCLLVSGEDHRHGFHRGFDGIALARAAWCTLILGRMQGGSTIEQQIVRVLTGRYERTLSRKLREIYLATLIADYVDKSLTPSLYLSIGYFGWRMQGYYQACSRLALDPGSLTLREAALVVARLKYPEPRCAPPSRRAQIRRRADYLLRRFEEHFRGPVYDHLGAAIQCRSVLQRGFSLAPVT